MLPAQGNTPLKRVCHVLISGMVMELTFFHRKMRVKMPKHLPQSVSLQKSFCARVGCSVVFLIIANKSKEKDSRTH